VIGTSASKTLESLSKDSEEISYFPEATLESFYEAMKESCRQPSLPLAAVNDMKDFVKDGAPYAGGLMSAGRYLAGDFHGWERTSWNCLERLFSCGHKMVETLTGDENAVLPDGLLRAFEHFVYRGAGPHLRAYIVVIGRNPRAPAGGRRLLRGVNPKITCPCNLVGDLLSCRARPATSNRPLRDMLEARSRQSTSWAFQGFLTRCAPRLPDIFGFGRYGKQKFQNDPAERG
jgi:hypothetical protein